MFSTRLLTASSLSAALLAAVPSPARAQAVTAGAAVSPSNATVAKATGTRWVDTEYRLGAGDKLRVEVYREPQLSQSLQVRPDGKITLPLIGDVDAQGSTAIELRDHLSTSLKEYVTNPVVTVIVTDATAARAFVMGEVNNPGAVPMTGPMTVLQALAVAGGFKEFADRRGVEILRRTDTGVQRIRFDYKRAVKSRQDPVYLQPGDTVVVP